MNKVIYTLLLLTGLSIQLHAQSQRTVQKIESGTNLEQFTSSLQQYLFQEFEDCIVMYNDSSFSRGKMNYNLVVGEMQFLVPNSEQVLALSNIGDIATVTIAGRVFVPFSKGGEFLEILVDGTSALAIKRRTVATPYGKEGAYGTISSTTSIESINAVSYDGKQQNISVSDYKLIESKTLFYIVANGKKLQIAGKKTILNSYPKNFHTRIDQFITANKINLRNEADLVKLIKYCNIL